MTVLTTDVDTFAIHVGGDNALLERVRDGVRIVRVPTLQDLRDPVINRWPAERAGDQRGWARQVMADQAQAFPETVYAPWGPRARSVALHLHERDPIDIVLATGNPYVDFTVPLALHTEYDVPFVLDDRDSWVLDVYTGELSPDAERARPWLEAALAAALEMWFVNPPIAEWHRTAYPEHAEKIRVVENGWDPDFIQPERLQANQDSGKLTFSFIGTINSKLPLDLIGTAWREARQRSDLLADAQLRMVGHFGHAGEMTPEQRRIRDTYAPHGMFFSGRQAKTQIGDAYAAADVLLFAKEGSGLVTSGKIYEYVATGRPIVSMIERSHDARRILSGYPRWHDAETDQVDAVVDAMVRAAYDARDGDDLWAAAAAYGERFRRDAVLAMAIDALERKLGL